METPSYISEMEGKESLPRKNGELVFQEPWEGKVFAMAVALHQKDLYPWDDFRDKLIHEISQAEKNDPEHETERYYYEHWQQALVKVLAEKKVLTEERVNALIHRLKHCEEDN